MSDIFKEILKSIPLYTRIKVFLEMEYLNVTINPDRCCTDEEFAAANEWSHKNTEYIISEIKQWQDDGAPIDKEKE